MDLITDFAYPLPATVIAELLGVPSEDHDTFRQWADNIVSIEVTSDSDIDSIRKADKTIADMDIYFSKLIEKKRKYSLLENPQEFKQLQENQNSLIKPTIEETLRYRSPVQFLLRVANADVSLSEVRKGEETRVQKQEIKDGQRIILFLGSANHDESIFTDPKRFDVTHKNLRHLGFETGIHFCFCLGAPSFTWIIILSLRFQPKNN